MEPGIYLLPTLACGSRCGYDTRIACHASVHIELGDVGSSDAAVRIWSGNLEHAGFGLADLRQTASSRIEASGLEVFSILTDWHDRRVYGALFLLTDGRKRTSSWVDASGLEVFSILTDRHDRRVYGALFLLTDGRKRTSSWVDASGLEVFSILTDRHDRRVCRADILILHDYNI